MDDTISNIETKNGTDIGRSHENLTLWRHNDMDSFEFEAYQKNNNNKLQSLFSWGAEIAVLAVLTMIQNT